MTPLGINARIRKPLNSQTAIVAPSRTAKDRKNMEFPELGELPTHLLKANQYPLWHGSSRTGVSDDGLLQIGKTLYKWLVVLPRAAQITVKLHRRW